MADRHRASQPADNADSKSFMLALGFSSPALAAKSHCNSAGPRQSASRILPLLKGIHQNASHLPTPSGNNPQCSDVVCDTVPEATQKIPRQIAPPIPSSFPCTRFQKISYSSCRMNSIDLNSPSGIVSHCLDCVSCRVTCHDNSGRLVDSSWQASST